MPQVTRVLLAMMVALFSLHQHGSKRNTEGKPVGQEDEPAGKEDELPPDERRLIDAMLRDPPGGLQEMFSDDKKKLAKAIRDWVSRQGSLKQVYLEDNKRALVAFISESIIKRYEEYNKRADATLVKREKPESKRLKADRMVAELAELTAYLDVTKRAEELLERMNAELDDAEKEAPGVQQPAPGEEKKSHHFREDVGNDMKPSHLVLDHDS